MVTYHKTLMGLIFKLENHASITQEFVPKNMAQWITLLCGIAEFNPWHPHGGGENHLLQATPSPKPNQTKPTQTIGGKKRTWKLFVFWENKTKLR